MGGLIIKTRMHQNGKCVYEYRFEIAAVNGKRKWKSKSGFTTKREAKEAGKIAQQEYESVGKVMFCLTLSILRSIYSSFGRR